MAFKYKNNLQNADSNYFSKSLYLLEDSVIGNNKTFFNICGNMDYPDINYSNLNLQFSSLSKDENTTEIKNASCSIIKANETEYTLDCIPYSSLIKGNVDLPFSDLGEENLVVLSKNETNLIDMGNKELFFKYYKNSRNELSEGVIAVILLCCLFALIAILVVLYLIK